MKEDIATPFLESISDGDIFDVNCINGAQIVGSTRIQTKHQVTQYTNHYLFYSVLRLNTTPTGTIIIFLKVSSHMQYLTRNIN